MTEYPLWRPSAQRVANANLTVFIREVNEKWGEELVDYGGLYQWSISWPERFWLSVWDFGKVIASTRGPRTLVDGDKMPGAKWFPDARLNFAENLLRRSDEADALVFWGEDRVKRHLSHAELYRQVSRLAQALRAEGVRTGDRVAAYLPNIPETIVAMLAAASIGAIFSSSSPDFGAQGVFERFGQIEPKVLITADGYYYGGKTINMVQKLEDIVDRLPSLQRVIVAHYAGDSTAVHTIRNGAILDEFVAGFDPDAAIHFEQLPFDHPLYIMFSSGTTGVPKCIVHGSGGVLLQHLKEHLLHGDVKPEDRLFYFTTCGWMMWNWLASGLATGATLLLYDGSPSINQSAILFDYAEAERMTHLGTSAKFIDSLAKQNLEPARTHDLSALRTIFSTGSPLAPEGFDYIYKKVKRDVNLASISGGTDIISCFVLGNSILPVWRGEIQCRGLGMAMEVFGDDGRAIRGEKGELVCIKPFPAMPIGFWNDSNGNKYRAAYFNRFPNVWCHGDYVELTRHDGVVIHGRSDAVLNPGGVRIGTAEIYRQVEKLEEVVESLAIGQEWPPGRPGDVRVVLFVKLRRGLALDEALIGRIQQTIRSNTTPRHVPAKVVQVEDIPRTKSGKIVELAVRNVVHGEAVKNREALANPESLEYFRDRSELRS